MEKPVDLYEVEDDVIMIFMAVNPGSPHRSQENIDLPLLGSYDHLLGGYFIYDYLLGGKFVTIVTMC